MHTRSQKLLCLAAAACLLGLVAAAGVPGRPTRIILRSTYDSVVTIRLFPAKTNGLPILDYRIRCWPFGADLTSQPLFSVNMGTGEFIRGGTERRFIRKFYFDDRDSSVDTKYSCAADARSKAGFGPPSIPRILTVPKLPSVPNKPSIRNMKPVACTEWPCAQILTVDVKPPSNNGGAAVTSYTVSCLPRVAVPMTRALQVYAPLTDPSWVRTVTGLGETIESDRIRFTMTYPYFPGPLDFQCSATASNVAGTSVPSSSKTFVVPTSPPLISPQFRGASVNASGVITLAFTSPLPDFGITGFEIKLDSPQLDVSLDGLGERAVAGSPPVTEFNIRPGAYSKDVQYTFTARYVNDGTSTRLRGPVTVGTFCTRSATPLSLSC